MKKIKVAVLFGGQSPEHEVSIQSGKTIIAALLEMPEKYEVLPIYITSGGGWRVNAEDYKDQGYEDVDVDVVFPALHGKNGEDGTIQGLCELAGLPCVGAGVLSSALCMDKAYSKKLASFISGLGQVPFVELRAEEASVFTQIAEKVEAVIGYPCFCKPANAGSSRGISRSGNREELRSSIKDAFRYDRKIMVEKAVEGRELEVGVLGNWEPVCSPVGEVRAGSGFYDYDAKYTDGRADIIIPADIPEETAREVKRRALEIFKIMGCAGMARVDFFLEDGTGRVLFNEINTIPGFTPTSMFQRLFAQGGIPLPEIVDRLVSLALERKNPPSIKHHDML